MTPRAMNLMRSGRQLQQRSSAAAAVAQWDLLLLKKNPLWRLHQTVLRDSSSSVGFSQQQQQQQLFHEMMATQKQKELWASVALAAGVMAATMLTTASNKTTRSEEEDIFDHSKSLGGSDGQTQGRDLLWRIQESIVGQFISPKDASSAAKKSRRLPPQRHPAPSVVSSSLKEPCRILIHDEDTSNNKNEDLTITTIMDESLYDKYEVNWDDDKDVLGRGAYGSVHLCYRIMDDDDDNSRRKPMALKCLSKMQTDREAFMAEVQALSRIQKQQGHEHIMGLRDLYQDAHSYYLVMDVATGGDLYDDLVNHEDVFTPTQAARLIAQLASALDFLHRRVGMVHADLKPENVLLRTKTTTRDEVDAALTDFGCASTIIDSKEEDEEDGDASAGTADKGSNKIKSFPSLQQNARAWSSTNGTSAYWAPERFVRNGGGAATDGDNADSQDLAVTPAMDVWSLGVLLYILLTRSHPFDRPSDDDNEAEELDAISSEMRVHRAICTCTKPPQLPIHAVDGDANDILDDNDDAVLRQDLINQLLEVDPSKRCTARDVLEHPWIVRHVSQEQEAMSSRIALSATKAGKGESAAVVAGCKVVTNNDDDDVSVAPEALISRML